MFGPNIFANGYADFFSVDKKWLDVISRLEVALLVKNIESRQKWCVSFTDRLAGFEQSSGVTKRFAAPFVAINEPDEQRRVSDASVQLCQQFEIFRNEARFENEILRRISGDRQLRCKNEFCARYRE